MGYTILKNLPQALKDKPKWVPCLALTSSFLIITLSAVTIGAIFGYTYCYLENRSVKAGNTQPKPFSYTEDHYNRTINGALMSSVFMSRIMKIGHALLVDTIGCQSDKTSNGTNVIEV